MPEKLPFKLYRRPRKNKPPVFYARYLRPDGNYTAGRSTGKSREKDARVAAWEYLQTGAVTTVHRVKLKDFAQGFFDWEGDWAVNKRAGGLRISPDHCRCKNAATKNHIVAHLGDRLLTELDSATVRRFRNDLYRSGLAGATINHILGCLRAILFAAEEANLLRNLPRIERAALNQRERGILATEEVARLFAVEWDDERVRVANMVAVSTGFRLSEIHGLKRRNILDGRIEITGSWSSRERCYKAGTKNGQLSRSVPIPPAVQSALEALMQLSPWSDPETYVFYTENAPDRPFEHIKITRGLVAALTRIGIDESERKRRNLTFHSHRHFFNSMLIEARVPLQKIQRLTGHLSAAMTQRYYHTDSLDDVAEVQRQLFTIVKPDLRQAAS